MKKDVKEVIQGEEPHLNNSNRNRSKVFRITR